MQSTNVLIVGVGGLGTRMVQEAMEPGLRVPVLVRNQAKLEATLGRELVEKLDRIEGGDGSQPQYMFSILLQLAREA